MNREDTGRMRRQGSGRILATRRLLRTVLLTMLAMVGCSEQRPIAWGVADGGERPAACVTIFFADGMDLERMRCLLDAGKLPHIASRFVIGGVAVDHALAALPPITYANAVSIITGQFPGHHDVLGNRWFDPRTRVLRDYGSAATYRQVNQDFDCPTIYELLGDAYTVNVQGHTRRGVSDTLDNPVSAGLDWLLGDYAAVDARVGDSVAEVAARARRKGRWPLVYFNYFPGLDEVGHRYGADAPEYAAAMITVDAAIGKIIAEVEARAPADRRYYVLLSDHGHVPTPPERTVDLAAWLADSARLRVYTPTTLPGNLSRRNARLAGYDALLITGAFRRAAIHRLAPAGAPADHVSPAQWPWVRALPQQPGVAVVCTRAGRDTIHAASTDGSLHIIRRLRNGVKEYQVTVAGDDGLLEAVLNAEADLEQMAAGWHDSRTWLAASANARFPDFVPQVVEMFDSPRTGDVIVFADDDYSFAPGWRGGHGSCARRDMQVPLYFAGPDLPPGGHIPSARLVDVVPTVLDLLNACNRIPADRGFDGVNLLPALRSAGSPAERTTPPGPHEDPAS